MVYPSIPSGSSRTAEQVKEDCSVSNMGALGSVPVLSMTTDVNDGGVSAMVMMLDCVGFPSSGEPIMSSSSGVTKHRTLSPGESVKLQFGKFRDWTSVAPNTREAHAAVDNGRNVPFPLESAS